MSLNKPVLLQETSTNRHQLLQQSLPHIGMVFVYSIWGLNTISMKVGGALVGPVVFNAMRFSIAAVFYWAVWLITRNSETHRTRISLRDLGIIACLGLLNGYGMESLLSFALQYTTAGNSALLGRGMTPIIVAIISLFMGRMRWSKKMGSALIVALLGTVLVIVGGPGIALGASSIKGDLMMLSRSIMGAIYLLMVAKLMAKYPVRQMLAFEYTFGALFLSPFLFVHPAAWVSAVILDWSALRILLFSSIFALGVSFLIHNGSVGKIGGFRVAVYGYLQPLTALLFGWWLLAEQIKALQVLGGIAILAAMYVVQRQKWENADKK